MEFTAARTRRLAAWMAGTALAAGGIVGVAPASPAVASPPEVAASAAAGSDRAARFEVEFLMDVIDHHMMAVMMAQMCQEKAVHGELEALCASIESSQMTEIMTMQTWLHEWYGIAYHPDMMEMPGMQSMHRMHSATGEEFEVMFLRTMIRHHWGAVREADKCLANAEHSELLTMCEDIKTTQLEEIRLMQGWLLDWSGLRAGRPA